MAQVLLVDDDPEQLEWMNEFVRGEGFTTVTADSLRNARIQLTRFVPDLILTDLMLTDGQGIELLDEIQDSIELVVMTGHASVETAVDALRSGAADYLIKPIDMSRLRALLQRIPKPQHFRQEIGELRDELRRLGRFGSMLGNSPAMHKLYDQLSRVAPTSASVMLIGESGTGKEMVAQTIHALSRRKREPFLPLNCGAVSPQLIESELFGHEKGSFTGADRQHRGFFERANHGTLFLDEVTEMRADMQVKLLRVLETGTFMRVGTNEAISTDVRVIAATNRNPEQAVQEGRLREDLFHRLNVFPLELPPLRDRGTDIELLAQHFLDELNTQEKTGKRFTPAALSSLYAHAWPGNVRELKNYVQRAYIMSDDVIDIELESKSLNQLPSAGLLTIRIGSTLEDVNRRLIEATLVECDNVKRKTAEMLGISLKTLYNKLALYQSIDEAEGRAGRRHLGNGDDQRSEVHY